METIVAGLSFRPLAPNRVSWERRISQAESMFTGYT